MFGILRYRTESIEVRNLTYLFVVIGLAVLNALVTPDVSLWELLLVNAVIVGMVAGLEWASFSRREESRRVVYDRLDLLAPGRSSELIADLRTRTQLPVERYEIGNVDLLRDTAELSVYYRLPHADAMDSGATRARESRRSVSADGLSRDGARRHASASPPPGPLGRQARERILIVEDDARLAALLQEYLSNNGFDVDIESRGDRAVERICKEEPALVILDLMLPGASGFEVCRLARQSYSRDC